jgi:very-short-patch-repair endonuclease
MRRQRHDVRTPTARRLRAAATDAEKKMWWHLRRLLLDGTHFRRQAPIGPYFADFACHERRLVIEIDGGQHGQPDRKAADAERTAFLNSRGYRVLRFWNNDVLLDIEAVMTAVFAALQPPTPNPSPPQ